MDYNRIFQSINTGGGGKLYIYNIERSEVERKDVNRLMKTLKNLDKEGNACNRVWFSFDGYNDDRREIYEIDEIRKWAKVAFNKIPHLLYYAERDHQEGVGNLLAIYLDGEYFYNGERVNAYEAVERGLVNQPLIHMNLVFPMDKWKRMKQHITKHAIKHNTLDDAKKTIEKIESDYFID